MASDRKFDLFFFDGNHKYRPTLDYFKRLKNNYSKDVILIFDDIHWNDEMKKAWERLKKKNPGFIAASIFINWALFFTTKTSNILKKKTVICS